MYILKQYPTFKRRVKILHWVLIVRDIQIRIPRNEFLSNWNLFSFRELNWFYPLIREQCLLCQLLFRSHLIICFNHTHEPILLSSFRMRLFLFKVFLLVILLLFRNFFFLIFRLFKYDQGVNKDSRMILTYPRQNYRNSLPKFL